MKKVNISVPQLLIEFISVVFAVLLALGLNSHKQSRDTRQAATAMKSAIINECKKNLGKIDSVLIKNRDYEAFLDSLVRVDEDKISGLYFSYSFQLLTNGAWVITQNSSAANSLDQGFLLDAADIYHSQEFFHDFSTQFFQNVGMILANDDQRRESNLVHSLYYNVNVMNSTASELKKDYLSFLAKHDMP